MSSFKVSSSSNVSYKVQSESNLLPTSGSMKMHGVWNSVLGGADAKGKAEATTKTSVDMSKIKEIVRSERTQDSKPSCKKCGGFGHFSFECRNQGIGMRSGSNQLEVTKAVDLNAPVPIDDEPRRGSDAGSHHRSNSHKRERSRSRDNDRHHHHHRHHHHSRRDSASHSRSNSRSRSRSRERHHRRHQ